MIIKKKNAYKIFSIIRSIAVYNRSRWQIGLNSCFLFSLLISTFLTSD